MCEFCVKHGEGKKWYLRAENYSLEVAGKINAIKTVESFAKNFDSIASKSEKLINFVRKLPAPIQNLAWLV